MSRTDVFQNRTGDKPRARSTSDKRVAVPDAVWAPLTVTFLLAIPGLLGYVIGQPWLFPSLGPTAFLQAEAPHLPSARFYNVVVGHLLGLLSAFAAVAVFDASAAPSVLSSHTLPTVRLEAALLAVLITMLGTSLLRASHPPASATTLLIALGGMQATLKEAGIICTGVAIVAIAGEGVRQLRLRLVRPHS
ncbi:MAG TPA: HPP family protein [Pirellulales bacterium]|nr:HPP family protein [Pirellulales bacterium]